MGVDYNDDLAFQYHGALHLWVYLSNNMLQRLTVLCT